jgi:hypothetical protein
VPRPLRSGPLLNGGLFLIVVGAVLVSLGVPTATADGTVCEGIVIDYGTAPPSSPNPPSMQVQTADVAPGSDDYDALQAAHDVYALNDTGLLCVMNGYPADGQDNCDRTQGSQYFFWSYWEGNPYTNTWSYAEVGPAEHQVGAGQTYVQGWRYQNPGPASASAPPPSVTPAAAFAQACPGVSPVPGSGSSGGGGGSATTTTTAAQPASATTTTTPAPVTNGVTATTAAGTKGAPAARTTTSSIASAGPTTTTDATTTTTVPPSGPSTGSTGAVRRTAKTALASSTDHRAPGSSGNPALPIVLLALVVAGLGGVAWFRWRRRPTEE